MRLLGVAAVSGVLAAWIAGATPRESAAGAAAVPVESLAWAPVFPDQPSGPAMAVLWGDPKTGPVGFLVRFPAGGVVPLHVHSSDYRGMVVSGEFSHSAVITVLSARGEIVARSGKLGRADPALLEHLRH